MNLQAKKYQLIERIMNIDNVKIIDNLFQISLVDSDSNWENNLSHTEKKSIEKGLKDLKEGRVTSHEDVMKKYEKYL
jgi:hypothetical protein